MQADSQRVTSLQLLGQSRYRRLQIFNRCFMPVRMMQQQAKSKAGCRMRGGFAQYIPIGLFGFSNPIGLYQAVG